MGGYKPNPNHSGNERDRIYPAEVASKRPKLVTRIHCDEDPVQLKAEETVHDEGESMHDRFNRELRGGHAGRNDGDE